MRRAMHLAWLGALVGLIAPVGLFLYGVIRGGLPDPIAVFIVLATGGIVCLGGAGFMIGAREDALSQRNAELRALTGELQRLSTTDALTALPNRRSFDAQLAIELARASRYHTPLSLVMLDIDRFKRLNDTHGHPVGDEVLRQLARVLDREKRVGDLVCRYGGEEFVALLPHAGAAEAAAWAERVRAHLANTPFETAAGKLPVTASFGVSDLSGSAGTAADLLASADEALYQAKQKGRDRVEVAPGRPRRSSAAPAPPSEPAT